MTIANAARTQDGLREAAVRVGQYDAQLWNDHVGNYAGPALSERALLCPTHGAAERLDNMMCSSGYLGDEP